MLFHTDSLWIHLATAVLAAGPSKSHWPGPGWIQPRSLTPQSPPVTLPGGPSQQDLHRDHCSGREWAWPSRQLPELPEGSAWLWEHGISCCLLWGGKRVPIWMWRSPSWMGKGHFGPKLGHLGIYQLPGSGWVLRFPILVLPGRDIEQPQITPAPHYSNPSHTPLFPLRPQQPFHLLALYPLSPINIPQAPKATTATESPKPSRPELKIVEFPPISPIFPRFPPDFPTPHRPPHAFPAFSLRAGHAGSYSSPPAPPSETQPQRFLRQRLLRQRCCKARGVDSSRRSRK